MALLYRLGLLFVVSLLGCAEPWEEHCPPSCARTEQCGLVNEGFALHTYASYHYCCEPLSTVNSTRREEWNNSGECLRRCIEHASCEELERWLGDKACCSGQGELGACFAACGGY